MALDSQQQEELENVKRIWHHWLKWLVLLLLIVAALYLGYIAVINHQQHRNEKATDLLADFKSLMGQSKKADALVILRQLQQDYADTMAATIATSAVGVMDFYAHKFDNAARHFQWIYDHQKDTFVRSMAITDLVKIKMQMNNFDEALVLLEEKTAPELQFLFEDLRGDIYKAKGDELSAKQSYDKAIALLPSANEIITDDDIAQVRTHIEVKKIIQIP